MDKPEKYTSITVIICTLNEEQNLPYVLPKIPEWVDEILLVDGHSTDRTVEVAGELKPDIKVLPLLNGCDFAKGSRFLNSQPSMPLHRRFGNWVLVTATNLLYGTGYTDICSGYNAFWKRAIEKVSLCSDGFQMEQEMNVKIKKAGLRVIEVPCQDRGRLGGTSKTQDLRQGLIDLIIIIRERFRC